MAARRKKGAGTVEFRAGVAYARVTLPDGRRPWYKLGAVSEAKAADMAAALAERVRDGKHEHVGRARRPGRPTAATASRATVKTLGEAWTSGKLFRDHGNVNGLREKASADVDGWRLARLYKVKTRGPSGPDFGDLAIAEVREEDLERALVAAPDDDASGATRVHYYAVTRRLFELAIAPARLRTDNPCAKYLRPTKDGAKLFSYLFPAELLVLLACVAIPLGRRVLYALAVWTGLRKGSLLALRWRDVDLTHGTLAALVTKTDVPQMFEIGADLVRLLEAWRAHRGKPDAAAPLVAELEATGPELAEVLRADLRTAGVTREILFSTAANVEPIRFHDTRATFVTWAKRAGRSDGWIADRTGHLTPAMLARYARAARTLADLRIDPFPPLDGAIPELATVAPGGSTPPAEEGGPAGSAGQGGAGDEVASSAGAAGSYDHESSIGEGAEGSKCGVSNGDRTRDNWNHNPALYQLSYTHRASADAARAPVRAGGAYSAATEVQSDLRCRRHETYQRSAAARPARAISASKGPAAGSTCRGGSSALVGSPASAAREAPSEASIAVRS